MIKIIWFKVTTNDVHYLWKCATMSKTNYENLELINGFQSISVFFLMCIFMKVNSQAILGEGLLRWLAEGKINYKRLKEINSELREMENVSHYFTIQILDLGILKYVSAEKNIR